MAYVIYYLFAIKLNHLQILFNLPEGIGEQEMQKETAYRVFQDFAELGQRDTVTVVPAHRTAAVMLVIVGRLDEGDNNTDWRTNIARVVTVGTGTGIAVVEN